MGETDATVWIGGHAAPVRALAVAEADGWNAWGGDAARFAERAGPLRADAARDAFEAEHQLLFGHIQPGGRIDITALRIVGRGRLDWTPPAARAPQAAQPLPRERRKVWIDPAHGWREVPIYDGADLRPGCTLDGPLLIEERTMTAFIGPRDRLEVDARDDFLVHIGAAS